MAIGSGVLWFTGAADVPSHRTAVVPVVAPGQLTVSVANQF
jgi:hypothetical protein